MFPLTITFACATPQEDAVSVRNYDSHVDCLNGTCIVTAKGRYGLVDNLGKEILPPVYDDICYLTDEIAAAFSGQSCEFFDRSGRRLAEATVSDTTTPSELLYIYKGYREECRIQWDCILDKYARLHEYCRSEKASAAEVQLMTEEIRKALRAVEGPMEKDQKAAFEALYSDYR